jgi:uncharacterized protein (TIGR02265 family)
MAEKLVFESAIEGLFLKAHRAKLTPSLKSAIRELGIDLDRPLAPTYPLAKVNEATRLLRKAAYGHEPDDLKAYRAMGSAILDGYFDTLLGRALASVMRAIGFRRVIDRLPQNLASGNNYQVATLQWVGPTEVEVTMFETTPHPGLNLGVLERAFTHWFKAPGFTAEIAREHPPGATYRLRWTQ